jgi:hypothetical protein
MKMNCFCLALVLGGGLMGCRTASTSYYPGNQRSGAIINGLQMSLSVSMAHPADPGFDIADSERRGQGCLSGPWHHAGQWQDDDSR